MLNSPRRAISYPNPDHSDRPDVPVHMLNLVNALEVDAVYNQGTAAQRAALAHLVGTYFHETDTGLDWYDDGANWNQIGVQTLTGTLAARPAASAVPAGTLYRATDNGIVYRSDRTVWSIWSTIAGQELDYAQVVTNSAAITATTEATAVTVVTGNSIAYDGSRVKVEFFCPSAGSNTAGTVTVVLYRDSTVLGQTARFYAAGGPIPAGGVPVNAIIFDTPSAGSHIYKAGVFVAVNNVTMQAGAGGSGALAPMFLRVTRA